MAQPIILPVDADVNYITWSVRKPGEKLTQRQRSGRYIRARKYFKLPVVMVSGSHTVKPEQIGKVLVGERQLSSLQRFHQRNRLKAINL